MSSRRQMTACLLGKCLGYIVQDGVEHKDAREVELNDFENGDFLMEYFPCGLYCFGFCGNIITYKDRVEVQSGLVGPQIEVDPSKGIDRYLPGGANQIEFVKSDALSKSELVSFKQIF